MEVESTVKIETEKVEDRVVSVNVRKKKNDYPIATFSYITYPTANCQVTSIAPAVSLINLNAKQFKEVLLRTYTSWANIFVPDNIKTKHGFGTTSLLMDIRESRVDKMLYRCKKAGFYVRLKANYMNRTGSKMTILIIDVHGKKEDIDGA